MSEPLRRRERLHGDDGPRRRRRPRVPPPSVHAALTRAAATPVLESRPSTRMPQTIAVIGAGELGATLARRLAAGAVYRRVLLLDPDVGKARGKALDILQSGPVEGFDTLVEGGALESLGDVDAVAIADPPALDPGHLPSEGGGDPGSACALALGRGPLVVAGGHPALVEMAVEKGHPRDRVLGSAPVAIAAALRRHLALGPRRPAARRRGHRPRPSPGPAGDAPRHRPHRRGAHRPPRSLRRPRRPGARAKGDGRARWPWPPPPRACCARSRSADPSVLSVIVSLAGEYGHRGRALAVPARLGHGRVLGVVELDLDPVDRVAFDNAAGGR